ncbi:hypothetical protein WG899_02545 [Paucibacter sp. AS339]|uniref:hypothetical protein n=1 Tax=Paucibacter hankyongi TaxID=3133434 RepID=UPI0030A2902C
MFMKNDYFSVGEFCATAFQIRRCTGVADAFFFDWLISPGTSFDVVNKLCDAMFQSGNWDVVGEPGNEGIRVREQFSGLLFQHEFATNATGQIDTAKVEDHLVVAKQKFSYLKDKTVAAIKRSQRCVLVRAENDLVTLNDALARANQMRACFMPINSGAKIVLASKNFENEYQHPDFLMVKLRACDAWVGDLPSWDRLFSMAENCFQFQGV